MHHTGDTVQPLSLRPHTRIPGFTIVEVLVVIVVLGILVGIASFSYLATRTHVANTDRITTLSTWSKLYQDYKRKHGVWPKPDHVVFNRPYCLASDLASFPVGAGGQNRCNNYNVFDGNNPAASDSANLISALASVGTLPTATPTPVRGSTVVGPFVRYHNEESLTLTTFLDGTTCPNDTKQTYSHSVHKVAGCSITLRADY